MRGFTASDLNPVAWFILRCTLHYPRLMAGQNLPLPEFALRDRSFVEAFLKAQGVKRKSDFRSHLVRLGHDVGVAARQTSFDVDLPERSADFPWHLRAWGQRVLAGARRELASYYPTYAEFEPLKRKGRRSKSALPPKRFKPRPPKILTPDAQGCVSVEPLNAEFDSLYLEDPRNPRWVAKPAVAYLWARTAECGVCRAEIPLLKTRWLCKRGDKRVLLAMTPREDGSGVELGLESDVPRSRDDGALGAGTMSRSGAKCPCCGGISTMQDLRVQGRGGRLGTCMTAVVIDGQEGKEYRLPSEDDLVVARIERLALDALYADIPFNLPEEPTPAEDALGIRTTRYGLDTWDKLFTHRQLLAIGAFAKQIRHIRDEIADSGYPAEWREALVACLAPSISRLADRCSTLTTWVQRSSESSVTRLLAFALPMVWDFCGVLSSDRYHGGVRAGLEWIRESTNGRREATSAAPPASGDTPVGDRNPGR